MASSSASGSELAELKDKLRGLEEQKAAELKREKGARDLILRELNKDLDRVQAAITALSSGELYYFLSTIALHTSLVYSGRMARAFSWLAPRISSDLSHRKCRVVAMHLHVQETA